MDLEIVRSPISRKETHVWWMRHDKQVKHVVENRLSLLAPDELRAYSRYRSPSRKAELAAGRLLAKTVLAASLHVPPRTIRFDTNAHGKPFLHSPDRQPFFNLSHSRDLILLALSSVEVGVDVEKADIERYQIMPYFFTEREIAQVEESPDPRRRLRMFYVTWTRKEAVMKAIGKGLSLPPCFVHESVEGQSQETFGHDLFTFEPVSGYVCSVATLRGGPPGGVHIVHEVASHQFAEAIATLWGPSS